ncbi:unnamed protein product [Brugia timori]|uniref:G_PROTEIN_RECEP_F1_2 domain-containing protein n=1 Tax=Brugia timori TaxID=42155 RepID=A0A0R3R2A6_9BILA|nr:unnamed protein product [Brugia timori]
MKWYIINLLAAYCISNIGRNIDEQLEKLLQLDNVIHEIFHWLAIYLRVASFTLIRLTLFLYIFEIYSIYTLKTNIMEVFYKRKLRTFAFIYLCTQIISIPVIISHFLKLSIVKFIMTIYYVTVATVYVSSIVIIGFAIYTVYDHRSFRKNQRFKKALTPLIFYFLPITLIDLPSGVTAVASLIGINRNIIKVIWRITLIVLMIRTPTVVLITIFVLPPFRKAFFDLLGIKRRQQITVIPLHNNFLISR